jgi:hypothetical protein
MGHNVYVVERSAVVCGGKMFSGYEDQHILEIRWVMQ